MNSTSGRSKIRNTAAEIRASEKGVEIPPQKGIEVEVVSDGNFMDIMVEGTSKVDKDNILYDGQGKPIGRLDGNAYRDYSKKDNKNKNDMDR